MYCGQSAYFLNKPRVCVCVCVCIYIYVCIVYNAYVYVYYKIILQTLVHVSVPLHRFQGALTLCLLKLGNIKIVEII